MPTANELYPGRWLRAADLATPTIVTIDRVTIEQIGQGAKAERKPALHFVDPAIKPMILNVTNFRSVVTILGRENCDTWTGGAIELFAADVAFGGEIVRAIRIRKPRAARVAATASAATPAADPTDDAIF